MTLVPGLAELVPPLVERAAVLVEVLLRRLMGRMDGTERDVAEEGSVGPDRLRVVDELDRVVDQVLGDVVALLGRRGRVDVVLVVDELRGELVGLALQEPVEPVSSHESAKTLAAAVLPVDDVLERSRLVSVPD